MEKTKEEKENPMTAAPEMPKLSDAWPDKIMVQLPEDGKTHGVWHPVAKGWSVEYIRSDNAVTMMIHAVIKNTP